MSRYYTHLNIAKKITESYDGSIPLSAWLKDFFRLHKQMGSRDRKSISALVFGFYRLGHSTTNISTEERILLGAFLCHQSPDETLNYFKPEWNEAIGLSTQEKIKLARFPAGKTPLQEIFPWHHELSADVHADLFNQSFLEQPNLFIRIRPGKGAGVVRKLTDASMPFQKITDTCIALPNASKIDGIIELDEEAVIQDYNSQRTGDFYPLQTLNSERAGTSPAPTSGLPVPDPKLRTTQVWDCCAASGGKSIMAKDINPHIQLTVSDVRGSILYNLHRRFQKAGIKGYDALLVDLASANCRLPGKRFQMIIADLPCTGSGTWARTPEQLYFFKPDKIAYYAHLQQSIILNVIPALDKGGHFIYSTCSVFKKENEEQVHFIQQKFNLHLLGSAILKGYDMKADSMFIAVFEKP